MTTEPVGTVALTFEDATLFAHVTDPVLEDLSAMARVGRSLFLSCDETAGVERLTPANGTTDHWANHAHFHLGAFFDLPDGPKGEMDIEGLAEDDGWLWVVGSHSLKRQKPDADEDKQAGSRALRAVKREANRYFLGRVPLATDASGEVGPVETAGARRPQSIGLKKSQSRLHKWLRKDPLLAPFLAIPSKENGFDIEGLAARGDRVWLGLRGPVLRGHAVIIELRLKPTSKRRLKARKLDGNRRYKLHLIDSAGLGIRSLMLQGDDLLVLLGPTMSADGPARVLRWREATRTRTDGLVDRAQLAAVAELPYRGPVDHPEALEAWPEAGEDAVLVVYDAPAPARVDEASRTVAADVWRIDPR